MVIGFSLRLPSCKIPKVALFFWLVIRRCVPVCSIIFLFYFWPPWVFIATCKLSLVVTGVGCSQVAEHGLLVVMAFHVIEPQFQGE